jgi:cytochrome c oxidase cbb3-type subunit IV
MDINDIRSIVTVLAFLSFIGIVLWAWSGKRKPGFEEAAYIPFDDGDNITAGAGRAPAMKQGD